MANAYLVIKDNGAAGLAFERLTQEQFEAASGVAGLKNGLTAHVSATMTAPANLVAGDYVMAAGTFYRVIQNVANGGTLTVNGNVVAADVGAELNKRANQNGTYDGLTAGNAKQLISTVGVTDKVPYNFRTSGGGADIGDREVDKIVGGTVAWNQLVKNGNFQSTDNWMTTTNASGFAVSGGVASFTPTAQYGAIYQNLAGKPVKPNHVFLACMWTKADESLPNCQLIVSENINWTKGKTVTLTTSWQFVSLVVKESTVSYTSAHNIGFRTLATSGWGKMYAKDAMMFDLTQMFGTAIADYIYSLETANAGAGAAWFRKLFPKEYYAYDAGSLQSVKTSAHKMVGFNQFDKATAVDNAKIGSANGEEYTNYTWAHSDYIRVLKNTTYHTNAYGVGQDYTVTLYDENKNYIGYRRITQSGTFDTGEATYVILSTIKAHVGVDELVLNLHWDGSRDGEYEPYEAHIYALDPDLELRGIPKLDADDRLYYDGDEYESDGKVTRRYGIRAYESGDESLPDSVTDGTNTVYKLVTPTTESADPYQNPQIVDDFGTEEYVDAGVTASTPTRDVAVPVGHETVYQANLRAKLEMAPNSPDGDGDYIVRQAGGQNTYVPLTLPVDELPAAPTTDGTYTLKCTVSSGTPTFSWVS